LANAALEAFAIHVRVVLDFLYNDTPRNDDVIAQHFLPSTKQWSALRPSMSSELVLARARTGKEIAHLTYARLDVTPQTKPWPFAAIANDVSSAFSVFRSNAVKERLHEMWHKGNAT